MRDTASPTIHLQPLGFRGLNEHADPAVLPAEAYARGENIEQHGDGVSRRAGRQRIAAASDPTATAGSWTYNAATKYARITAAAQQKMPVGGFVVGVHFNAVRNANTGRIVASRVNGKAYGPYDFRLAATGALTASWRKESDESAVSHTSSVIADGTEAHAFIVYDPWTSGGRSMLVLNGEVVDTVTGVGANEQPMQDGPDLYLGLEWDPAGAAVVANSHFAGPIDTFIGFALGGRDISAIGRGGTSWLDMLKRESFLDWNNPDSKMLRWQYPADEGSGTSLRDSSGFKNHGTLVGGPSSSAGVCRRLVPGQAVGYVEKANGDAVNYALAGAAYYYQQISKRGA